MVTRGSPKPLLRVRVLLPLPERSVAKAADFFAEQLKTSINRPSVELDLISPVVFLQLNQIKQLIEFLEQEGLI